MMVSGYDTSLPDDVVKSLLSEHFSWCGEITKVYIPIYFPLKIRNKYAFVYITGEDAQEKALQLNGSVLKGRNLLVQVMPPSTKNWNVTPELAAYRADRNEQLRRTFTVMVTGYNNWVPEEVNKRALIKHFSSCGEVRSVIVFGERGRPQDKKARLVILGDGVAEKVQALSGCDMGGWNVQVLRCRAGSDLEPDRVYGLPNPGNIWKKAEMMTD